ncbi:MAG: hypothetical protein OQK04_05970 [Kangiellaceae bacterium]|nr:hypothetical protein [Kangiellaceae bacterium]MCW8998243.1 hypothetical protein [Kangiellaceae bacterium]
MRQSKQKHKNAIQFTQTDYVQLVDWLRRLILPNKRGYIEQHIPPVLERLNLNSESFIRLLKREDDLSGLSVIGSPTQLTHYLKSKGAKYVRGKSIARQLYG